MRIKFYSDLHVEFGGDRSLDLDKDDILVLAGDLHVKAKNVVPFVESFADKCRAVIYVLGNHDLWDGELDNYEEFESDLPNVELLQNNCIQIDDVVFLGGTFWTDYDNMDPLTMWNAPRMMNDFRKIRMKSRAYKRITAEDILVEHRKTKEYIKCVLDNKAEGKKYVVVTHHAPSYQSKGPQYGMDMISHCFYSNNDMLVEQANVWIHGHTHENVDYMIGDCRVISNQYGYDGYELCKGYAHDKFIEL